MNEAALKPITFIQARLWDFRSFLWDVPTTNILLFLAVEFLPIFRRNTVIIMRQCKQELLAERQAWFSEAVHGKHNAHPVAKAMYLFYASLSPSIV